MIKRHALSFKNAIEGLTWILKTQKNFQIHILLSSLAVGLGLSLRITYFEWLIIIVLLTIGLVIEAINTSIEEAIDAIHKDWSQEIKIAKDVSAAAMLIFALGSLFIAGLIFIPKIIQFLWPLIFSR